MTIQQQFAERITGIIRKDPAVIGLAVGGSWLTNEIDEYSDLDLVLVTKEKISHDKQKMLAYARSFGELLSGFTGEHVGEPRVLICLYASTAKFPYPSFQWIEDRFWVWVHYILQKIGRGEYMEAFDCFGLLRMMVLGPLLHIKNNQLPRGVRKAETHLSPNDLEALKSTVPSYDRASLIKALTNSIDLYKKLRASLFNDTVTLQSATEKRVMEYLRESY